MDDVDRRIVNAWSSLVLRDIYPTSATIAAYANLDLADTERRIVVMRRTGQIPND